MYFFRVQLKSLFIKKFKKCTFSHFKMSEIIDTLNKCFAALRNPEDPFFVGAQETLLSIYKDPSSFHDLLTFVNLDNVDEYCIKQSVIAIGFLYNKYYLKLPDNEKEFVFNSMRDLLISKRSYVRHYIKDYVSTAFSQEFLPSSVEFMNQMQENLNDITIEASLIIISMIFSYVDINEIETISLSLIEKGLNSKSQSTRSAALSYGLYYANMIQTEEGNQLLSQYIDCGIQLISDIVKENDESSLEYLKELVKAFQVLLDQEPEVDTDKIVSACLELMSNQNLHPKFIVQIQTIVDVIVINYVDTIAENTEIVQTIFQIYFNYAQTLYNPDEIYFDLTDHDIFSAICRKFSNYTDILELMWSGIITQISNTPEGLFISISALYHSLGGGVDYFQSKVSELSQLFIQGLNDNAACTNEAAAKAISILAKTQRKQIKSVSDDLIKALLNKLQTKQNPEFIESIESIADSVDDIGPIFGDIFNAMIQLLQACDDQAVQYKIFDCILALVHYSSKRARHFFQQISEVCFQVLSSGEENTQFVPSAIKILSFLIESSPKLFAQHVETFLQLVIQNLNSDDLQILTASIMGYGHLIDNYSEQLESSISSVLPKLQELASKDISEPLENDEEIFSGEDDNLDTKVEPLINVVVYSIRVATHALAVYPNLAEDNLVPIIEIIQRQFSVGDTDCGKGCAEGCCNLIECVQKIGYNEETRPVISNIISILTQIAESESGIDAAGTAFNGIYDIISSDEEFGYSCIEDVDRILKAVERAFKGENLYQTEENEFIEELHQPAMNVIREIIAAKKDESVKIVSQLVPIFNKFVSSESSDMRDLILQFFGDLVYWANNAVDEELKRNTFILACSAIEKRNSAIGFGVIKQLAVKEPQLISGNIEDLLGLIKAQLEIKEDQPTEALQSIQDNAESALAMIAMKVMKDQFPVADFLHVALNRMPAQLEVEENNDHIDFFFWLYNLTANSDLQKENIQSFVAVPVRLFSDPIDKLIDDYYVSDENVKKMLKILKEFSTFIDKDGFKNFVCETCDNDEFKIESVFEALESE